LVVGEFAVVDDEAHIEGQPGQQPRDGLDFQSVDARRAGIGDDGGCGRNGQVGLHIVPFDTEKRRVEGETAIGPEGFYTAFVTPQGVGFVGDQFTGQACDIIGASGTEALGCLDISQNIGSDFITDVVLADPARSATVHLGSRTREYTDQVVVLGDAAEGDFVVIVAAGAGRQGQFVEQPV